MKLLKSLLLAAAAAVALSGAAKADGELNIYNWGNYTSPEMIKKFEEAYKVKVTVTDEKNTSATARASCTGTSRSPKCSTGRTRRSRSGSPTAS